MSNTESSRIAELEDRIDEQAQRINQLEAENEQKNEQIESVESDNADLRAELAEYREDNERDKAEMRRGVDSHVEVRAEEDQDPSLEDVWIAGQPLGKIINGIQTKVDHSPTREDAQSDESAPRDESLTPMERVIRAGEEGVIGPVTASVRRAQAIAEHFRVWAKKTPTGLVIKDGLKTLVETATDERLFWKQIERAGHALEEFTKGAIQFKKTRRHGWTLVAQPEIVSRLERASSASGG